MDGGADAAARWRRGRPREPHELETVGSNPTRAPFFGVAEPLLPPGTARATFESRGERDASAPHPGQGAPAAAASGQSRAARGPPTGAARGGSTPAAAPAAGRVNAFRPTLGRARRRPAERSGRGARVENEEVPMGTITTFCSVDARSLEQLERCMEAGGAE